MKQSDAEASSAPGDRPSAWEAGRCRPARRSCLRISRHAVARECPPKVDLRKSLHTLISSVSSCAAAFAACVAQNSYGPRARGPAAAAATRPASPPTETTAIRAPWCLRTLGVASTSGRGGAKRSMSLAQELIRWHRALGGDFRKRRSKALVTRLRLGEIPQGAVATLTGTQCSATPRVRRYPGDCGCFIHISNG
jgi:hypothetical protein